MTTTPSQELNEKQVDEVKKKVIEIFGEEMVKDVDRAFLMFQALRFGATDSYDFLKRVANEDPEHATKVVAALLYGMRLGEDTTAMVLNKKHEEEVNKLKQDQDGAVIAPHVTYADGMYM
jgi:hypothetical protein